MPVLEEIIKAENYTGDLAKLLRNEEVTLPEGFEDLAAYEASLLEAHNEKRKELAIAKWLEPMVEDKVKEKEKDRWLATINPIKNKILTLSGLDKEKYAEANPKDLIDLWNAKQKEELDKFEGGSSELLKEKTAALDKKNTEIIGLQAQLQEMKDRHTLELQAKEQEASKSSQDYIYNKEIMELMSDVLPELAIGSVEVAKNAFEGSMRKHGYKLVLEDNESGIKKLVAKHKDGSKAMNLSKNDFVDPKLLVLELSAVDKYNKQRNVGTDTKPIHTTKSIVNGKEVENVKPFWL